VLYLARRRGLLLFFGLVAWVSISVSTDGGDMTRVEAIVVVDAAASENVLADLSRKVVIKHRLPPRIAVVAVDSSDLESIAHMDGVVAVCTAPIPGPVADILDPTERLFVEAWASGQTPKVSRPGDGLPWDAPGFQPPDMPDGVPRRN